MKANQAFKANDEAVSPVIGVILMVAITVVLAAVVFVLVTRLSNQSATAGENAAVVAKSPQPSILQIELTKMGEHGPYRPGCSTAMTPTPSGCATTPTQPNRYDIYVNNVLCVDGDAALTPDTDGIQLPSSSTAGQGWNVGQAVRINGGIASPAGCAAEVDPNVKVSYSVNIAGTQVASGEVLIAQ